jgi:hypothetical protein
MALSLQDFETDRLGILPVTANVKDFARTDLPVATQV